MKPLKTQIKFRRNLKFFSYPKKYNTTEQKISLKTKSSLTSRDLTLKSISIKESPTLCFPLPNPPKLNSFFLTPRNINIPISLKNRTMYYNSFNRKNTVKKKTIKSKLNRPVINLKNAKIIKDKFDLGKSDEINELIKCLEKFKSCELPKNWKYPHRAHKNLWHCTTLFKGKTKYNEIAKTEQYKQFVEGEEVKIQLIGIVYVPNGSIVMIIKLDNKISIKNKYPHITGFIKDFAPKYSNNVMECVMENKNINRTYETLMEGKLKSDFKENLFCEKIEIEKKSHVAYVKFLDVPVDLASYMHAFEK